MSFELIWYCGILFGLAALGGLIALLKPWSDGTLHLFVSFGAGVFLGAIFLDLLPHTMGGDAGPRAGVALLVGFLLILGIERIMLARLSGGEEHTHKVVSLAAFIALSVHSLTDGLGLAVGSMDEHLGPIIFTSILAHTIPAAFSVTSLLSLARYSKKRILGLLAIFSAMPPLGALVFAPLLPTNSPDVMLWLTGLVTGSFLYVATGDLLPEVFHSKTNRALNMLLLLAGIGVMAVASLVFEVEHFH